MPRLELFSFRYRNPVTGKWVRARYVATPEEIARGNAKWEIIGPPENPWAHPQPDETPVKEPPGDKPPAEKDPPSKQPPVKEPKQVRTQIEHVAQLDELETFLGHRSCAPVRHVLRATSALRTDAGCRTPAYHVHAIPIYGGVYVSSQR
ncbi:MAG TPA: hypothetical protein VKV24_15905 [Casimicrobiaceae bacterium]|nr:hypothetical protein [Casimicrobiaceae bacterium]